MKTPLDEKRIFALLSQVIDPEIGCNIVDLGLVYGVQISEPKIVVRMTLTTPGCPMHETIVHAVQLVLLRIEGIEEVEVELVWDPPWNPEMMSALGREHVGLIDGQ